jgi:hypothetical protein
VYVSVRGEKLVRRESVEWLLVKLQEQIDVHAERSFPQRERVLAYFERSRQILSELLEQP